MVKDEVCSISDNVSSDNHGGSSLFQWFINGTH